VLYEPIGVHFVLLLCRYIILFYFLFFCVAVPWQEDFRIVHVHKFSSLSVAPLLAEAIQRLHNGESLQHLRIVDRMNVSRRYRDQSEEDIYQ
jgi:hypothetical protein